MSKKTVTIKEEISLARANLENLLRNITQVNDGSQEESDEDSDGKTLNDSSNLNDGFDGSPRKKSAYNTKKKRKAAHDTSVKQQQPANTYVVKLFDRTVDVAPYSENAALYPLCRDWFRNNSSEQYIEQAPQPPAQTGGEMQFPAPYMTSSDEDLSRLRIPDTIPRSDPPLDIYAEPEDAAKLLLEHLSHWKSVRQSWKTASRRYDARFGTSHSILKQMYESSAK